MYQKFDIDISNISIFPTAIRYDMIYRIDILIFSIYRSSTNLHQIQEQIIGQIAYPWNYLSGLEMCIPTGKLALEAWDRWIAEIAGLQMPFSCIPTHFNL